MHILIAPDSFKETLDSDKVGEIIKSEILSAFPSYNISVFPISDGGEGALSCFMKYKNGGVIKKVLAHDPLMNVIEAEYLLYSDNTAVIETAKVIGLNLVGDKKNPSLTTSYGVGELILDALGNKATKIILTLGGSSTNDAGTGMATALGYQFRTNNGEAILPRGDNLISITSIDTSHADTRINATEFVAMCDVTTEPIGVNGATFTFANQKGAKSRDELIKLEAGVVNICDRLKSEFNVDLSSITGGGAAGALGMGTVAFLSGHLTPGFDVLMQVSNLEQAIRDVDVVITGEGKLDSQSFNGKVVGEITKITKRYNKRAFVLCGISDVSKEIYQSAGIDAVFPCSNNHSRTIAEILAVAERELRETTREFIKEYLMKSLNGNIVL
ncbi:MAG: glycerate kinase [Christensenellaceae bacterium]|jgi:glycerate kinase|nr:glycerate kinase [Christensenellaceae bacterium]